MSDNTCVICLENYTSTVRAKVTCPYCPSHACKGCVQRYLLTTFDDPHCLGCRRAWNREFLDIHLTKVFRSNTLRKHRGKILMDREKAILPAMQIFVEATKELRSLQNLFMTQHEKTRKLVTRKHQILRERELLRRDRNAVNYEERLDENAEEYGRNEALLLRETTKTDTLNRRQQRALNIMDGRDENATTETEAREFIQRCPADGCRGYLSTAYKCGTCAKFACSDCHAIKGETRDAPHTCDEEAKASAALIRRETKPCPKCGVRIYKIDGCDQMWCTQEGCQTAFSWRTGHVVTGVVHNPHYYEFLRKTGGAPPREAGDIPCGGLPAVYSFTRIVTIAPWPHAELARGGERDKLLNIHRCLNDMIAVRIPEYPARRPGNMNRDINIKYLMNEADEETWKKTLEQRETRFEKRKEIGQILTTFSHVGSELMRALEATGGGAALVTLWNTTVKKQCEDLRLYTNESLTALGKRMICAIPQILEEWQYQPPRSESYLKVRAAAKKVAERPAETEDLSDDELTRPAVAVPVPAARHTRFDAADFVDDENILIE